MKSADNRYYAGLDHVRGFAAFLVFAWHFQSVAPVKEHPRIFLLSIVDEGYCGVSLFMVLSGYLFAKLLGDRSIVLWRFYYNRLLRLTPLLLVAFLLYGALAVHNDLPLSGYLARLPRGLILPVWPGVTWSIATELHFYVLLPGLLWLMRRRPSWLLVLVSAAISLRFGWWRSQGTVRDVAYYTIVGRIDQFLFGMLACHYAFNLKRRHLLAVSVLMAFTGFYYWVAASGGYHGFDASPLWIVMPTIEAICFSIMVAYYDQSFEFKASLANRVTALAGTVSYSIYLLHPFFINRLERMAAYLPDTPQAGEEAIAYALVAFLIFIPVCWVSYVAIEKPLLRFRLPYAGNSLEMPPPKGRVPR